MTPFLTGGQPGFALTGLLCADSRNQFFSRVVSPARSVLHARARWLRCARARSVARSAARQFGSFAFVQLISLLNSGFLSFVD
jgi:hypothetical protein